MATGKSTARRNGRSPAIPDVIRPKNVRDTRPGDDDLEGTQNKIKLNPENPIPYEVGGNAFTMLAGEQYIPFFQPDDRFATTLLEARLLSTTHSSCVNTKNLYLVGNGVKITNLKPNQQADQQWLDFVAKANNRRQSLNRVFYRAFDSFQTFGNTPLEIVIGTTAGKPFMYLYSLNFQDTRLAPPNEKTGEYEWLIVSKRFRQKGILGEVKKEKKIPIYKTNRADEKANWLKDGNVQRTIVFVKNEVAGYDAYGLPSSVASLIYQVIEYSGGRFNLDNLDNNMVIGTAIFLKGGVTQAEADRIGSTMVKRHTGKGRIGRTMVFASENGIDDVETVQMEVNKEGSYKDLNSICESKIIMANDWDAILAGLKHESSLGKGGGYLKEVYEQKLKSVIIPTQHMMLEEVMPTLVEIAKNHLNADWAGYEFGFEPIQIDNKTSEVSTSVNGLQAFLDIVALVGSGVYPLDAAVKLVSACYGISEQEAKERLGNIVITGQNVRAKSDGKTGADNTTGSAEKNSN